MGLTSMPFLGMPLLIPDVFMHMRQLWSQYDFTLTFPAKRDTKQLFSLSQEYSSTSGLLHLSHTLPLTNLFASTES